MAERIQRLIATQKELSSAISHELRTPIARMRFALEMLSETDDSTERKRLWLMMEADLDELDSLIDSSLTYARFEREAPDLHLTPVELAPWLEEKWSRAYPRPLAQRTARLGGTPNLDRKSMPYAVNCCATRSNMPKRIVVSAELATRFSAWGRRFIGIPKTNANVFSAFHALIAHVIGHRRLRAGSGHCPARP
jgi:two-component system sensor histidine kinase RstB